MKTRLPNTPDERDAIERLRAEFIRVARRDSARLRAPRRWRVAVALAALVVLIPGGYAVAQTFGDPEGVPASECPEANAVLERYGLGPFERYIPGCPDPAELESALEERQGAVEDFPPARR